MLLGSHGLFGIVLYLGLLGGGVLFVKQTVIEFMKGATSYTEENKQVTLHDLPTILICLDFERDSFYSRAAASLTLLKIGNQTFSFLKFQTFSFFGRLLLFCGAFYFFGILTSNIIAF